MNVPRVSHVVSKRASLDAQESDVNCQIGAGESERRISVEEDISHFFAQRGSSSRESNERSEPVKGTIQSFFLRNSGKTKSVGATDERITPLPPSVDTSTSREPSSSNEVRSGGLKVQPLKCTWSCDVCTYINQNTCEGTKKRQACKICGSHRVLKVKGEEEKYILTSPWTCKFCTFFNSLSGDESIEPGVCKICSWCRNGIPEEKLTEHKDEQRLRRSVSSFQDTSTTPFTDSSKRLDANRSRFPHTPLVENSSTTPSLTSMSSIDKEKNWVSAEKICLDLTTGFPESGSGMIDLTGSQEEDEYWKKQDPATDNSGAYPSEPCLLSFSISKNTGRISIHSGQTGAPLQVNFDISDVIAEESLKDINPAITKRLRGEPKSLGTPPMDATRDRINSADVVQSTFMSFLILTRRGCFFLREKSKHLLTTPYSCSTFHRNASSFLNR